MNAAALLNGITRENVSRYVVQRLHEGRSIAQANIDLLEIGGHRFVLKDFRGHNILVRNLWGRRIIARETRLYRHLKGIEGIPRVLKQLDPFAFIMEYGEGSCIRHRRENGLTAEFFDRLKSVVAAMHERGVTHGDLRRKNIIVTPEKHPLLIDFAGAFCLKGRGNFLTRAIFDRLKNVDNLTVLKLQNMMLPGTLTPEEARRLASVPWFLRLGRFLKKKIYRPFKHATRKRRNEEQK